MNKKWLLASIGAAVVAAWIGLDARHEEPASSDHLSQQREASPPAAETPAVADATQDEATAATNTEQPRADETSEDPAKMFAADAAGNLILSERTRLNVEKLSALYSAEERAQRLAIVEQVLPATAYRQLVELTESYRNLTLAARQQLPPGVAPASVEDAITQHELLHSLRVAHLGAAATDALFGEEERINRRLLDFMSLEQHEGMTLHEKAEKAQQLLLQSPELVAAYEKNRRDAALDPHP